MCVNVGGYGSDIWCVRNIINDSCHPYLRALHAAVHNIYTYIMTKCKKVCKESDRRGLKKR